VDLGKGVQRILPITAMAAHAIAATDCARRAGQWHPRPRRHPGRSERGGQYDRAL